MKGIIAAEGIAIGTAFRLEEQQMIKREFSTVSEELDRLKEAVESSITQIKDIKQKVENTIGSKEAEIFDAHMEMLQDPVILNEMDSLIQDKRVAEEAVEIIVNKYVEMFLSMDDEYMRQRSSDIQDIGKRILQNLQHFYDNIFHHIKENSIIVANDLTPSYTAQLPLDKVIGFVTEIGGKTSHSAIMARSLGIPALVGVIDLDQIENDTLLFLDANAGELIPIKPEEKAYYQQKLEKYLEQKQDIKKSAQLAAQTIDGQQVEVVANIGNLQDVKQALTYGAEGVGLFRTEFLYMDRSDFPTEEEQYNVYSEVAKKMGNQPVIIRTLDIGGDKSLSYYDLPKEMNPFLGKRALRLLFDEPVILETQLRAILRAGTEGNIKMMFPMVSTVEEIKKVKEIINKIEIDLSNKGISHKKGMEIGIMVEVPSVAISPEIFVDEIHFFSIGSNDLIQYTLAMDRTNQSLSYLYQPGHPSILRLIKNVIDIAHQHGKWVGVCGEIAGDTFIVPLLLGMELDEFSMSASSIPKIKYLIQHVQTSECKELLYKGLKMQTYEEVEQMVRKFLENKDLL